jgi:heat shock protein HtpX
MTTNLLERRPGQGTLAYRRLFSPLRRSTNAFKTAVLLGGLGGLFVLVGSLFGQGGALLGLLLGLALVGGSYWFSDTIAIRAAGAVPVSEWEMPEYHRIVRELCVAAGLPMPKLYVTPDRQPNAFATGRDPDHAAVAVTRGILDILSWAELKGVLAHELSHIGNRDVLVSSVAAALATAISFLANSLMWMPFLGGGSDDDEGASPLGLLVAALLAPLAAGLLQMALSRNREFEADATGARLLGDGRPLARALAKLDRAARVVPMDVDPAQSAKYIVNPLTGRHVNFARLFMTHPSTDERIRRLVSDEWASRALTRR